MVLSQLSVFNSKTHLQTTRLCLFLLGENTSYLLTCISETWTTDLTVVIHQQIVTQDFSNEHWYFCISSSIEIVSFQLSWSWASSQFSTQLICTPASYCNCSTSCRWVDGTWNQLEKGVQIKSKMATKISTVRFMDCFVYKKTTLNPRSKQSHWVTMWGRSEWQCSHFSDNIHILDLNHE